MTPEGKFQADLIQHLLDKAHLIMRINQGNKGGRNLPARWFSIYCDEGKQQTAGISDVLSLSMEGRLYCWECKTLTGKARESQLLFHREAARRGAVVAVVRTLAQADEIIENATWIAFEVGT